MTCSSPARIMEDNDELQAPIQGIQPSPAAAATRKDLKCLRSHDRQADGRVDLEER